ncbi:VOC family protein [Mycobacterium sp. 2YAF39]|uniref:VOC family protein n=1 Tax=Mycobacterium sp. 2YAF39 TaxID=3233033 RepID=UPI003F9D7748
MDWTLEVVVVPVADTERAIAFYRDQLGFDLDHHTQNAAMNFAQLTPPGSGCSIVIGELPGGPVMAPGSLKGLQLVVADAHRARDELLARGVDAEEMQIIDDRDGGTLFGFADPDGNTWVVQQITARADQPLLQRQA